MKKLLIALMLLCSVSAFAKEYTEVVQVPDKNADQLYSSAREWFAETFKSAQDVLQMDDPVAGKLIGKGITTVKESYTSGGMIKIPIYLDYDVRFTVKIFVKDGRYKYNILDLNVSKTSVIDGDRIKGEERSFQSFLQDSTYYKNASDPNWLVADFKSKGKRMNKATSKQIAEGNKATLRFIHNTDVRMQEFIESLKKAMAETEDDW